MRRKTIAGLCLLLINLPFWCFAQKRPNAQLTSIWAPANIKIDGKPDEWKDQFQAYNRGNYMYYTVSNDDNDLYLTVHINDWMGVKKVFRGGLTFTIAPSSKNADRVSVTFPAIKNTTGELEKLNGPLLSYKILKEDTVANKAKIDALITSANGLIMKIYNEIHVTGIPGTNGPFMSIFNTQGIKVGAQFDKKMEYTYELAIPLKYLEAAISNAKSFKYNIQLNSHEIIEIKRPSFDPPVAFGPPIGPGSPDDLFLFNDTDFSGEYTLAKNGQ